MDRTCIVCKSPDYNVIRSMWPPHSSYILRVRCRDCGAVYEMYLDLAGKELITEGDDE